MKKNSISYDKALKRVEEIVSMLEKGDRGIDELSELVKEASGLVKLCKNKLRMTEDEINNALNEEE
ncbi:exodeoxyribonuclease VII small subunit [Cyclobacteriaceae bacterium YHN15]|jgi:exodeoxyribonuclease VII small subunit|nr:exodeoxyribonuclease VII small subunit [Cyclobacteriaceae bacterium YHN15]